MATRDLTYVDLEILLLVEFAELVSDGTVSGSRLETLFECVSLGKRLVGKVWVLLKVLFST